MSPHVKESCLRIAARRLVIAFAAVLLALPGRSLLAQNVSPQALQQIQALATDKASRTPAQRKIDSSLLYAARVSRGQPVADGVPTLRTNVVLDSKKATVVDVIARVDDTLLEKVRALGGEVLDYRIRYRSIRARLPITALETLAADPKVIFVSPKREAVTHRKVLTGRRAAALRQALAPVVSEGVVTHRADQARATLGATGAGVKVGVLSDGVDSLALLQAAGVLPAVTVLPGQAGSGDEGTAMLEIVHDMAPNAELYFASAFNGIESFAQNIRALRAAGCDILVDDVTYFVETPFQKGQAPQVLSTENGGVVTQAVVDVAASGALFFSSAANSGNKDDGTSGTWEGDYVDGGPAGSPIPPGRLPGNYHNFGGGSLYDLLTGGTNALTLFWSDPLGGASDDYDVYVLDATGTTVVAASTNTQDGTQDPFEGIFASLTLGSRVVIVKYAGDGRFLHLDTNEGVLAINTPGNTHGHNAPPGPNAFGVAATPADGRFGGPPSPIGPYPNPFNSSNLVELFSSDGPRRFFFNADGSAITPGNVSSTGGEVVQQPLMTAADGVSSDTPGFDPFFGTSAAAPHAAAIAALVRSLDFSLTPVQLTAILTSTAIDIMAPGVDRDSGYGILDALSAAQATGVPPRAALVLKSATATEAVGNGNGSVEPGECANLTVQLLDGNANAAATAVSATLVTTAPGVTVSVPTVAYPDIPGGGTATGTVPFRFSLDTSVSCPYLIPFTLTVNYLGGVGPQTFAFSVRTGTPPVSTATTLDLLAPSLPSGATAAVTGQQTGRLFRDGVPGTCATPKTDPGLADPTGARQYDAYTFVNCSSGSACINVTLTQADFSLFSAAYSGSFNPATIEANYLADSGFSDLTMSYSFNVAAGATFVVVVHEVTPGSILPNGKAYTLTVDGACLPCGTYSTTYACCATALPAATWHPGVAGTAYVPEVTLTPTGGTGPFTFTVTPLPPGMTPAGPVSGDSVSVGGTPTGPFSGTVLVSATDATGCRATRGYSLTVVCPPPSPIVVTAPTTVGSGSPNRTASVPLHAGSSYAWTITNGTITAGQGTSQVTFTAGTAGTLTLGVTEVNPSLCVGAPGSADVTVAPAGSAVLFYTAAPCRQLDTRNGGGTPLAAGATLTVALTGAPCGIAAGATSVSVNLAVTQPAGPGHLTIYPTGGAEPTISNINFNAGQTRANNAVLTLSGDGTGRVNVVNGSGGTVHVILDVNGYFQ